MAESNRLKVKRQSEVRAVAALPLSIARSELFSISSQGGYSKQRVLATARKGINAAITYTGPHLTMEHFRAWQALLYVADERGQLGGELFVVPASEMFWCMGKSYKDRDLKKKLYDVLTEVQSAVVTITSDGVEYRNAKLIDEFAMNMDTKIVTAKIGARISTELLDREVLRNDLARMRGLGRHHFAIWLHGFISSQASRKDKQVSRHTFEVDEIRRLCGSKAKERIHFTQALEGALDKLKKGENPLVKDWDWCDEAKRKVWVDKTHTLVKVIGESAEVARAKRGEAAAQAARSRKARVAL